MAGIRLTIGAAIDRSLDQSLASVVTVSKRARSQIAEQDREQAREQKRLERERKQAERERERDSQKAERGFANTMRSYERMFKLRASSEAASIEHIRKVRSAAEQHAFKERIKTSSLAKASADREIRDAEKQERAASRAAKHAINTYEGMFAGLDKSRQASEDRARKIANDARKHDWDQQLADGKKLEKLKAADKRAADRDAAAEKNRNDRKAASDAAKAIAKQKRDTAEAIDVAQGRRRDIFDKAGTLLGAGMHGGIWAARGIARIGGEIARGAGVNLDVGSVVQNYVERDAAAARIVNSGIIPGASGVAGVRQNRGQIIKEAERVGNESALDPNNVLKGLHAFTKVSGDLRLGRDLMSDLARLSRVTGDEFEQTATAAGQIAKNLTNIPQEKRAAVVMASMKGLAGQGRIGAVEMPDMARYMAYVASAASQIGGGDTVKNILTMGALSQEARGQGGAATAAQATRASMGFITTLQTPARLKKFREYIGAKWSPFDSKGDVRDPRAIILESLKATGGDPIKMHSMFANVIGGRAVTGFTTAFKQAGGGAAGEAAYNKEFDKLMKESLLTDEQVAKDFAEAMDTAEAKVQLFNNQIQEIAGKVLKELIPSLERLGPKVEYIVDKLGAAATFIANNLGITIAAACTANILTSALGMVVAAAIQKVILAATVPAAAAGAVEGVVGGVVTGATGATAAKLLANGILPSEAVEAGLGGAAGAIGLGGGLLVGAAALAGGGAGYLGAKAYGKAGQQEQANNASELIGSTNALQAHVLGRSTPEQNNQAINDLQRQIEREKNSMTGDNDSFLDTIFGGITALVSPKSSRESSDAKYNAHMLALKTMVDVLKELQKTIDKTAPSGGQAPPPNGTAKPPPPKTGSNHRAINRFETK